MCSKTKLLSTDLRDHRRLTQAVTNYIVKDVVPVYTVDKEGFRDMVHALNPRYQLPHKDYFSRIAIPSLYEETRQQLAVKMKKEANYFSGTADLWSSCTSEPYLCFTIHYVDTQWNLQTHCLQAHYLPEDHTGVQLQDALSVTLEQWDLNESKLTAITTDSASNIKLACQLLKWRRLSCFGHNLDLAINKGLNDNRIERALSICRKVVAAFLSSWKRQRDLKDTQVQKGLPQKKLKGDVCTRWGSKANMVERIVEQQDAIRVVLGQDRKTSYLVPTWQDLDVLQSVLKATEGFKDLTDLLSGEKQITCSAIKPLIKVINDKIVIPQDDDSELTLEIKGRIKADLASRYENSEINQLLDVCSFLDPRFKDTFTSEHLAVLTLLDEIDPTNEVARTHQATETESYSDDLPGPSKKKGKFSAIFGSISSNCAAQSTLCISEKVKREIDMYLQYPTLDIDESPLDWWKLECKRMPLLSTVARKYLCVCATSVASERVFSIGGHLVSRHRNSLKPEKVNNLIFLAKNLNNQQ